MPRHARIKPEDTGAYYHLTNRIAGMPGDLPFGDVEKEKMVGLIKKLNRLFTIEVLAYQVMGNHMHIVCYAPAETLPLAATAKRFNSFYKGRRPRLDPTDPYCLTVARQMRDISCLMSRLQQQFTTWFNRTRSRQRRGTLWAQRFKSVLLERDTALWNCLCYVEMNAVRAGLVGDPGDYRFGSWGQWYATGRHPFGKSLRRHLVAYEGETASARSLNAIWRRFRVDFSRRCGDAGALPEETDAAMCRAAEDSGFLLRLDRRIRYWTDGLIIGSRIFVLDTAERFWCAKRVQRQRLQRAIGLNGTPVDNLYSWSRLHAVPD